MDKLVRFVESLHLKYELNYISTNNNVVKKIYNILSIWTSEFNYFNFSLLKQVSKKYPKICYYLLWKNEFNSILNILSSVYSAYKRRWKTLSQYDIDLIKLRQLMHDFDNK